MSATKKLTYHLHKSRWWNCKKCELHEHRARVVLLKGKVPCDILFVGEAPGNSENVIGKPFVGPAGKLLDKMVTEAFEEYDLKLAYTNLVACIPRDETLRKVSEPSKKAIATCHDRLLECLDLCRPRCIVCVGKLPAKRIINQLDLSNMSWTGLNGPKIILQEVMHPAGILRLDVSQQGLAIQRTVITLLDLARNLIDENTKEVGREKR